MKWGSEANPGWNRHAIRAAVSPSLIYVSTRMNSVFYAKTLLFYGLSAVKLLIISTFFFSSIIVNKFRSVLLNNKKHMPYELL